MIARCERSQEANPLVTSAHNRELVLCALLVIAAGQCVGCKANEDMGSVEAMKGSLFGDAEVARVADLMARDLVRDPLFYQSDAPPRIALVRVENDTTQYMFGDAREAYLLKLRTYLKRALKDRIILVEPDLEKKVANRVDRLAARGRRHIFRGSRAQGQAWGRLVSDGAFHVQRQSRRCGRQGWRQQQPAHCRA